MKKKSLGEIERINEQYITLQVLSPTRIASVQIKLDEEGIVIDVFDRNEEVAGSTWVEYSDLEEE